MAKMGKVTQIRINAELRTKIESDNYDKNQLISGNQNPSTTKNIEHPNFGDCKTGHLIEKNASHFADFSEGSKYYNKAVREGPFESVHPVGKETNVCGSEGEVQDYIDLYLDEDEYKISIDRKVVSPKCYHAWTNDSH